MKQSKIENELLSEYLERSLRLEMSKNMTLFSKPEDKSLVIKDSLFLDIYFRNLVKHIVFTVVDGESILYIKDGYVYKRLSDLWEQIVNDTCYILDCAFKNENFMLRSYNTFVSRVINLGLSKEVVFNIQHLFFNADGTVWDLKQNCLLEDVSNVYFTKQQTITFKGHLLGSYTDKIGKMLTLYANGKQEYEKVLMQLIYGCVIGKGVKKLIFLNSGGGFGKSTFISMCGRVGLNPAYTTVDMLENDNGLKTIKENTGCILGDDLSQSVVLFAKQDSRLKSIISGKPYNYTAKYENTKTMIYNGMMIQAVNGLPKMRDDKKAVLRRVDNIPWQCSQSDLEELKLLFPDIDMLIEKDEDFYQSLLTYILVNVSYYKDLDIPKDPTNSVEQALNEFDVLESHLELLNDMGYFEKNKYISLPLLYQHFIQKFQMRKISEKLYVKKMKEILLDNSVIEKDVVQIRFSKLKLSEFNPYMLLNKREMESLFNRNWQRHNLIDGIDNLDRQRCYLSKKHQSYGVLDELYSCYQDVVNKDVRFLDDLKIDMLCKKFSCSRLTFYDVIRSDIYDVIEKGQ